MENLILISGSILACMTAQVLFLKIYHIGNVQDRLCFIFVLEDLRMNLNVLKQDVLAYLHQHERSNIHQFALKKSPFQDVSSKELAQQLFGRQIAKDKFPVLYEHSGILYPPKLNLEQSSSQITAEYKAELIRENESLIDLTGGFGIDSIGFSQKTAQLTYCEKNKTVYDYAEHNFKALGLPIEARFSDGIEFLKSSDSNYDLLYIDPSRRDKQAKKVFRLEDCSPNVLEHMNLFKAKAKRAIIKLSPLVDIDYCLTHVDYLSDIHIVSVKNEVKELLLVLDFNRNETKPRIHVVNLDTNQEKVCFKTDAFKLQQAYSDVKKFLYEPHPGLMKSGAYGWICQNYKVKALAQHSHLFTSDEEIQFPGRRFQVNAVLSPNKKSILKAIGGRQANVSCRNYPLKPEQVKKKYGMIDGSNLYVFFTTSFENQKIVIVCKKLIRNL